MVMLIVMPALADKGIAVFDDAKFILDGDFGNTLDKKVSRILVEIPSNVVGWSRDDLNSQKMGPLFIDVFNKESNDLRKHELALLLIAQRPRGWANAIKSYISNISKNSFYLFNVWVNLRTQYRYGYCTIKTLREIENLIKVAVTKHVTGNKDPGPKLVEKTIPTIIGTGPVIPPRAI